MAAARLILVPFAALGGLAHAIGLGEISQQSAFGTSLRVVVPVVAGTAEDLAGECVRLIPAQRSGDGIPEVRNARIALERTATGPRIVVMSPRAVTDPVLKFTLQAGCDSVVRREYLLLMDPLPIDVPVAQDGGGQRSDVAARAPESPRPSAREGPAAGATSAVAAAPARRAPVRRRAGAVTPAAGATGPGPAATAPRSGTARARVAPKAPTLPAAMAPAAQPRLTVSTAAPAAEPRSQGKSPGTVPASGAPAPGSRTAAVPADSSAALDAEAAALQQRVIELTALVDRMQQEIRATEAPQAAQGARIAAEDTAKAGPQAALGRWWNESWPLLVGVVGLAALIAALLSYRRRRALAASGRWRMESPSQGRAEPPPRAPRPVPVPAVPPQPVAAASPRPQVTAAPATATSVDVSELSHVTEEAGVYLAFDRPDRAIDVLQEHIRANPHSLPAAWLMLLDLYHAQGREQEFAQLANVFHAQFNVQTPTWSAYRQQAQGDRGLEGFPHLIRQLVLAWGKPECREFLDHLLHENRDGRRTGFSLAAYEDILFLRQLADPTSADSSAARTLQRPSSAAPLPADATPRAAAPSAAALVARPKRPPTLDLELALDEDMLDAGKSRSPAAPATPPAAKDTPKDG